MRKVLVFGTFDIFHKGHINFLEQARSHGDYLVVVIARDETVRKVKGRLPKNDEQFRKEKVRRSGLAEEVIWGGLSDKYEVVQKVRPDVICLGYDQTAFTDELEEKLLKLQLAETKVVRLAPYHPEIYKSSKLSKQEKNRE